jgi:hypothetical protein
VRGARAFSLCSFKKHTSSTKSIPLLCQKNINKNGPIAGFPPSVRLKEHQTKHTSLILTKRLQYKKSLGRIFDAATPPGALVSASCVTMIISGSKARQKNDGRSARLKSLLEQFDYPARALICYTEFGLPTEPQIRLVKTLV